MTKEEAIYRLNNTAWLGSNKDRVATEQAVQMAIEALNEQKTGKWREYNYPGQEHVYCSSCKEEYYVDDLLLGRNEYPNYCPNCGTYMRGEEE